MCPIHCSPCLECCTGVILTRLLLSEHLFMFSLGARGQPPQSACSYCLCSQGKALKRLCSTNSRIIVKILCWQHHYDKLTETGGCVRHTVTNVSETIRSKCVSGFTVMMLMLKINMLQCTEISHCFNGLKKCCHCHY